jgi:hypothetical protein
LSSSLTGFIGNSGAVGGVTIPTAVGGEGAVSLWTYSRPGRGCGCNVNAHSTMEAPFNVGGSLAALACGAWKRRCRCVIYAREHWSRGRQRPSSSRALQRPWREFKP